jgi:hypothetical protein
MEAVYISEESENLHQTTYRHVLFIVTVMRTSLITLVSEYGPGADSSEDNNEISVP